MRAVSCLMIACLACGTPSSENSSNPTESTGSNVGTPPNSTIAGTPGGTTAGTGPTGTPGWTNLTSPASASDAEATFTMPGGGNASMHGVAHVGDLDGDAWGDLVLASPGANGPAGDQAGQAWVVYGAGTPSGDTMLTYEPVLQGRFQAKLGTAAAGLDLDQDGFDDLLVSAHQDERVEAREGAVYLRYGGLDRLAGAVAPDLDFDASLWGAVYDGAAGAGLASVGDLDQDGYPDAAIGRTMVSGNNFRPGAVHLVYGGPTRLAGPTSLETLPWLQGENEQRLATTADAIDSADLDGDGLLDLVVGSGEGGQVSEQVSVVYGDGARLPAGASRLDLVAVSIVGQFPAEVAGFGDALTAGPDADGDGYPDVAVGAYQASGGASQSGAVYLFRGGATRLDPDLTQADAFASVLGTSAGDHFGRAMDGGDFDGDGLEDLIVGAPRFGLPYAEAGAAYVFRGGSLSGAVGATDADLQIRGEGGSHTFGWSLSVGDFDGDGWSDVLVDAPGYGGVSGRTYWFPGGTLL